MCSDVLLASLLFDFIEVFVAVVAIYIKFVVRFVLNALKLSEQNLLLMQYNVM